MKITLKKNNGKTLIDGISFPSDILLLGDVYRLHGEEHRIICNPQKEQVETFIRQNFEIDIERTVLGIEGCFLAIFRTVEKTIFFCDRYCLHPWYYQVSSEGLCIYDEILTQANPQWIDPITAKKFVLFRFVPGRRTLFEGINRIMPGEVIEYDRVNESIDYRIVPVYPKKENKKFPDKQEAATTFENYFLEALENGIARYPHSKMILPLSGGLDSRYILAATLEIIPSERVITMTFGAPGSLELEIGARLSREVGVKHLAYPLTVTDYDRFNWRENCLDSDGQISFTREAPSRIFKKCRDSGDVVLSGYVGDAVMGNKATTSSENIIDIPYLDALFQPGSAIDLVGHNQILESFYYGSSTGWSITNFEQWFFLNHFSKYSTYSVFKNRSELKYISPFLDYTFTDYVLNLPHEYRKNRNLYIEWLQKKYKRLFSLPTKTNWGLPLGVSQKEIKMAHLIRRVEERILGIPRMVNQIDFKRHLQRLVLFDDIRGICRQLGEERLFEIMIKKPKLYSSLFYNLECLDIIQKDFACKIKS